MDKIKVVHLLNTSSYSGAENVAITLIKNLKNDVECTYVSPNGNISEVLKKNEINYYPLQNKTITVKEIRKMIEIIKPDIIHAHDFTASILSAITSYNVPVISHLHNNPLWIKKINIKTIAYYLSVIKYKRVLTVSHSVVDEFCFGKNIKKKTMVIGNPFDIESVKEKSNDYKVNEDYDLIFIGRLTEQKNPMILLDIINELKGFIPTLKVAVIGDGELKHELIDKIKENNLSEYIKLFGFVDNPFPILRKSKVLCIPSKWEGFGLVSLEALSLGKPVVGSPVGGLVDIINDKCGKLCKSLEDYVSEISKLINDCEYYESKKKGALQRVQSFNNIEEYKERILDLYKEIDGGKNGNI